MFTYVRLYDSFLLDIITHVFDASQATSHSDISKKIGTAQDSFDGTIRDRRENDYE